MKKKKVIIGSLLCSLLCVGVGAVKLTSTNPIEACAFEGIQFAEQYVIGDIVSFPEAGFTQGEQYYKAETVLHYPDGSALLTSREKFTMSGEYTLEYRAEVNGKLYTETYEFDVLEELYSVSGSASSVSYGLDDSEYQTGRNGLAVNLAEYSTFTYNKVLDLSELNGESVISFMMLPETAGVLEANIVMVKLTDAYDDSNTIYVRLSGPTHAHSGSWSSSTGMLFAGTSTNQLLGQFGTRIRNSDDFGGYGYQYVFTFGDNAGMIGKYEASFSMDVENKCLYGPEPQDGNGVTDTLFADLGDESVYPSVWKGFTTGEVYLSLYCSDYRGASANIFITKIGNEDLSIDYHQGGIESLITVDTGVYTQGELPMAQVNKAYPLFNATVYDFYQGESAIFPRVFYRYGTWMESEINVENNVFVPDRAGVYTLVYGYEDGFGNYVNKTFEVEAVESVPTLTASLPEEKITSAYVGLPVQLAKLSVSGGSGEATITTTVAKGNNVTTVNEEHVFTEAGVYDVEYTIKDYLGTEISCSYQIEIKLNPTPVAQGSVVLPKYFIAGHKYVFPSLSFVDYSTTTAQNLATEITVTDGDGTHKLSGNEYVAKAAADGNVRVQYGATSSQGTTVLPEIVVPVVDVSGATEGDIDIMKYFRLDEGFSVGEYYQGLRFATSKDGGIEFVNPLLADVFTLSMNIDAQANDFEYLDVYLTDSINEDACVRVRFQKDKTDKGAIAVYVNERRINASLTANYTNGKYINFEFSGTVLQIGGSELYTNVRETLYGEAFDGFKSGKVYLKIMLGGVKSENSAIILRQLNNQKINATLTEDKLGPQVVPNSDYKLVREIGSTVQVYDAVVGDVLNGYTSCTITVVCNNKPVKSVDGEVLANVPLKEYEFIASEYGEYTIQYTIKDGKGNSSRGGNTFSIMVLDEVPPVLTIEGNVPYSVSVGQVVTLPAAKVEDNLAGEFTYYVYVSQPNGMMISCHEKLQFTPEKAGTYYVTYMTSDVEGNLTVKKFTVEAK